MTDTHSSSTQICTNVAKKFLEKARNTEPTLQAFRHIDANRLLTEAAELDANRNLKNGSMYGFLFGVKEVYDVAGYECSWGTPIHSGRKPTTDSAAVKKLREMGSLVAGITVSTEYAMGRTGPTVNPHNATCSPGASSQGSAAAVGAGLVSAALGSQTIGSIIRPASYCGCIGIKPTWNLIDVSGSMKLSEPIDHGGVLAADPAAATAILSVLAPNVTQTKTVTVPSIKVIEPWYEETHSTAMMDAVKNAASTLRQQGYPVTHIKIPTDVAKIEAITLDTILAYGMSRHYKKDLDNEPDKMSSRIIDYIERGFNVEESAYLEALNSQNYITKTLNELIGDSVALMPAALGIAPSLKDGTGSRAPQRLWTLAGLPSMTVPFGKDKNMPLGVQLIAGVGLDNSAFKILQTLFNAR